MATLDNTDVVREFYRAFNEKDVEAVRATMHPDALMESIPFETTEKLIDHCMSFARAFPDGKVEITQLVAQGDNVVAEFIGRATHRGPLPGPGDLEIPPTNRHLEMRIVEVFQLRDGRISMMRQYFDTLALMTQLGIGAQLMPAQAPEAPGPEALH